MIVISASPTSRLLACPVTLDETRVDEPAFQLPMRFPALDLDRARALAQAPDALAKAPHAVTASGAGMSERDPASNRV